MTIRLAKVVETCSACPTQWDAWTVDGQYLYLRYRYGMGTVDAYDTPDWETWCEPPDGKIARFGTPSMDGQISLEDFLTATGLELTPNAEVTPWPT
ncbi:hypothetical protein AB0395_47795 [Streptosporangium sp. NPDC051023]|uniref:hypothetical protein n=1 Tax=Streptosporangium sp. NPDC051023 TaxID=3155410 RepID=UPI003450BC60